MIFWLVFSAFSYLGFSLWSYTQTDPNLMLSYHSLFFWFQQTAWGMNADKPLLVGMYVVLICLLFLGYVGIVRAFRQRSFQRATMVGILTFLAALTLFSHPALSHDIYNYLFNAKMVLVYHANPHIRVALDFPSDDWLRFMHNVHTPAPYGYGWTGLSLIPYLFGFGKFLTIFLSFKLFMLGGYLLLAYIQYRMVKLIKTPVWRLLLFLANPLVLIETLVVGHNDIWMMVGVFASLWVVIWSKTKKISVLGWIIALASFVIAIEIKFVPLLLIPVVVILKFQNLSQKIGRLVLSWWPEICALILCAPLLTARSQQFHPWYLIWALSFLPFMRSKLVITGLIVLSWTSLLRYVPFLWYGDYSPSVVVGRLWITWSAIILTPVVAFGLQRIRKYL